MNAKRKKKRREIDMMRKRHLPMSGQVNLVEMNEKPSQKKGKQKAKKKERSEENERNKAITRKEKR